MKKIIVRYGLYAGIGEFVTFVLVWLIIDITGIGHKAQGAIGYVAIICPMVFVYFGIRYYRDRVNNGSISFLQALKVGMLIIVIPAVSYSIIETVYVIYIDPHFYERIYQFQVEEYRKVLPPTQYAAKVREIKQQVDSFKNPVFNFFGMILTMAALGTISAVISALLTFRRPKGESLADDVSPAR
ncbi:DUF4199 domain-containing protein [Mucilaginibacter sp. BJC16-A38]|uniref:DUF4199 domain-containing protein n=1 Tax=Mucilaginibacter phenanthrenivorans TaxID=1234842 RepID=UPI0021582523|nr:DUF4199 domain-containing protein [Mucilaginibacter phenanthrenivorans]MCR8556369.1 DUF4199 domain-containing protein [Mucilaginibacter phenanthrenivorans]